MKKSKGRKKFLVPVVALCSVGLAVGTGYAAWTITQIGQGSATGNRNADTVEKNEVQFEELKWYEGNGTVNGVNGNPTVCFGWGDFDGSGTNYGWLSNGATGYEEKLVFTLQFKVTQTSTNKANLKTPTATFSINEGESTAFTKCVNEGLIVQPQESLDVVEASSKDGTYTALVEFKWGTAFTGVNPRTYYNSHKGTDPLSETDKTTYAADAETKLGLLAALKDANVSFKVTLDVELNTTASA